MSIKSIPPAQASDEPMRDAEIIASFEAAIDNEVSLKPGDISYWVRQDELLAWFRDSMPRVTADVERVRDLIAEHVANNWSMRKYSLEEIEIKLGEIDMSGIATKGAKP